MAFDAKALCAAQCSNEASFEALVVPERCRGADAGRRWFEFASLDELFPGSGIGEAFDESAEFREALRMGARSDRVDESPVRWDLSSSAQGTWRGGASDETGAALGAALGAGAPSGEEFFTTLGSLTLDGVGPATGHFIEIVGGPGARRKARYAWHQDRGGDDSAVTVMVGFPSADNHRGCGVFSHVAPLSHYVTNKEPEDNAHPREFYPERRFLDVDDVPDASIVRPEWCRGKEILVYSDARNIHTSPDIIHRDCLWRFM